MNRIEIATKIKNLADELKEKEEPTIAEYLTDVASTILLEIENTVSPLLTTIVSVAVIEAEKCLKKHKTVKKMRVNSPHFFID